MNQTDRRPVPVTTDMAGRSPSFSGEGDPEKATNEEMISSLNSLIETCRDGQQGFKEAAEGIDRSDMKTLFYEYSQQRAAYVGDLQSFVQTLGGDPEDSGSFTGALHRGWINIKSAVMGKDEASILNEVERGEDAAKEIYKQALKAAFPNYIMETLEAQYMGIQAAHDRVRALRDAANSGGESLGNEDRSTTARTGH